MNREVAVDLNKFSSSSRPMRTVRVQHSQSTRHYTAEGAEKKFVRLLSRGGRTIKKLKTIAAYGLSQQPGSRFVRDFFLMITFSLLSPPLPCPPALLGRKQ